MAASAVSIFLDPGTSFAEGKSLAEGTLALCRLAERHFVPGAYYSITRYPETNALVACTVSDAFSGSFQTPSE